MPYRKHVVAQGECMASIAYDHGFLPETIWDDPKNAELREQRDSPNILFPGDVVRLPEPGKKTQRCQSGQRHRFRRKGVPQKFRLRLLCEDEPRANEPYLLKIEGTRHEGQTDADGWLEEPLPPDARRGELRLSDGEEVYPLAFRTLDPIDTVSGVQARLHGLGFFTGEVTGELDEHTESAIHAFQSSRGLSESGRPDDPDLQAELREEFGS